MSHEHYIFRVFGPAHTSTTVIPSSPTHVTYLFFVQLSAPHNMSSQRACPDSRRAQRLTKKPKTPTPKIPKSAKSDSNPPPLLVKNWTPKTTDTNARRSQKAGPVSQNLPTCSKKEFGFQLLLAAVRVCPDAGVVNVIDL